MGYLGSSLDDYQPIELIREAARQSRFPDSIEIKDIKKIRKHLKTISKALDKMENPDYKE